MPAATPTLVAVEITDADHERGVMSALPSITDLRETSGQVRKVPIGDMHFELNVKPPIARWWAIGYRPVTWRER